MTADDDQTDRVQVRVRSMTPAEFEAWRDESIKSYAEDTATATGRPIEAALQRSRQQFAEYLPAGLATEGTWLLTIIDDGVSVGTLWIGPHPDRPGVAYIYDIVIDEVHRGRGLGRAAMVAAEGVVTQAGIAEIALNVFGFNERARRLYDSLGYRVVATQMAKSLG